MVLIVHLNQRRSLTRFLYEFYVKDLQRQIVNVSKGFGTNQIDETIKTNFAKFFDDGQSEMRGKTRAY